MDLRMFYHASKAYLVLTSFVICLQSLPKVELAALASRFLIVNDDVGLNVEYILTAPYPIAQ